VIVLNRKKELKLQVETIGVRDQKWISWKKTQVRSTWKFDAWTNSRWWRIFTKVEFVSNIMQELGYAWTLSCNRCG
jgi:hypothetical protein